jgi:hypothetical protein
VLPWDSLRAPADRRARRRTGLAAPEHLEGRELLSYSSLGSSLPDLRVTALASPVAVWGQPYNLTPIVQNIGASTIVEPLSLVPADQVEVGPDGFLVPPYWVPSTSNVPESQIGVYLTRRPHGLAGAVKIGTITAPPVPQNDVVQVPTQLVLPARPAGFANSGQYFLRLVANDNGAILEGNTANNVSPPIPVRFAAVALPRLTATALGVPPVMQPGDTIRPTIQITNLGSGGTAPLGPVEVALVASVTPDFNLGSSIVALYTVTDNIPGLSNTPTRPIRHRRHPGLPLRPLNNVVPAQNVTTIFGAPVTLPSSPELYFLGVVIDPNNKLPSIGSPDRLQQIRQVGPPIAGLPPAGVVSPPLDTSFPNPPAGTPIGIL